MAANQRDVRVKNLSNNVLGMKFMSRTQEATKREQLEEEQKKKQAEAHWNLDFIDREELTKRTAEASRVRWSFLQTTSDIPIRMIPSAVQFEQESSYLSFLASSSYGRKSFNNFNKEIEKVALEMEKADRAARAKRNEELETVSAKEMTSRYRTLLGGGVAGGTEADSAKKRKRDPTPPEDWNDMAGRKATRFKHLNSMGFMKPE